MGTDREALHQESIVLRNRWEGVNSAYLELGESGVNPQTSAEFIYPILNLGVSTYYVVLATATGHMGALSQGQR